jgi:hypothetical protein
MNERIKLPAQEWLGYDPEKGDIHGYTFEQMQEFAELIVRECTNICEELGDKGLDGHYCVDKIKEHFGIQK